MSPIDLSGQADVYSDTTRLAKDRSINASAQYAIRLSVERSPLALGRVFGLIGTVSMIPTLSQITIGDVIDVDLEFSYDEPYKLDLLRRKFIQLTETIEVRIVGQ